MAKSKPPAKKSKGSKKGMGFAAAQKQIAEESGEPMDNAGAMLASSTRKASAKAKKANPNLKKVKGSGKGEKASPKKGGKKAPPKKGKGKGKGNY